jgi:hypothetical protein
MYARYAKPALIILIFSSFLVTCGELDTVLPSTGTYQVNALVNGVSLNDSSLINVKDRIYPYFVSSVASDPDVTGLTVFLQTPSGQGVGKKIHYSLKTAAEGQTDKQAPEQVFEEPPAGQTSAAAAQPLTEKDQAGGEDQAADQEQAPAPDQKTDAEDRTGGQTGQKAASAETAVLSAETEALITVNRLDRDLPFFVLPENLEMGLYVMVFQVLGEHETLYREDKTIYYLGNARFSLIDIQQYLPDVSGSHLVPPGTTVMLEAQVLSDARLDPYVVWYNGKRRISEGRLADGGAFILWKAPDQNGFYTIRAEVFPQRPVEGLCGKFREISLPISAKAAADGYFSGEADRIAYWYQFRGNLQDSKTQVPGGRALVSPGQGLPRWTPGDTVYGLSVGSGDVYRLSAFSLVEEPPSGKKQDAGCFMLRFKPSGEGTVFSARFDAADPSGRVYLDLNFSEKGLSLDLTGPNESAAIALGYSPGENNGFISLFIDFALRDGFEAGLRAEHGRTRPELKTVALSGPLSGTGAFQFGASLKPSGTEEAAAALSAETPVSDLAVLDEFALAFPGNSPADEEPEAGDETGAALAEAAEPSPEETPSLGPAPADREPGEGGEENADPSSGEEPDSGDASRAAAALPRTGGGGGPAGENSVTPAVSEKKPLSDTEAAPL